MFVKSSENERMEMKKGGRRASKKLWWFPVSRFKTVVLVYGKQTEVECLEPKEPSIWWGCGSAAPINKLMGYQRADGHDLSGLPPKLLQLHSFLFPHRFHLVLVSAL